MRREVIDTHQFFRPLRSLSLRDKGEALEELLRPCGRFKSPLPLEQRLQGNFVRGSRRFDPLREIELVRTASTPLNWQLLLRYLHREGVVGDPHFHFDTFRNDIPKLISGHISADLDGKTPEEAARMNLGAFAAASSVEETISKATGEILERHFFRQYKHLRLLGSSFEDLRRRKRTLDIFDLNGYLPWQQELFPAFKRDPASPMHWVAGTEVATGKRTYLPAQIVFWGYASSNKEMSLGNPTTNGCAGHFTREEALLSSLLEIIQRDGFLIYWLNSLSPKVIDVSQVVDEEFRELLEYVERYRLKLIFLNTSSDMPVPSVTCAVIDTCSDEPLLAIGAGTGFSARDILLHAAREALSVYSYVSNVPKFELAKDYAPFRDPSIVRSERLAAWRGKEMLKRFEFFISGPKQSAAEFMGDAETLTSVDERLNHILTAFKAKGKGYEVYEYEVKNEVLQKIGYHLVRAVVPQMFPLYLVESMPTLDSKRLREVPEKLGYKVTSEMNPWPHPFP